MKTKRRLVQTVLAALILPSAYLLLWPIEIDPAAWTPPAPPRWEGVYAPNTALDKVWRLFDGLGAGPETISRSLHGKLYVGYRDGRILRANLDGSNPEEFLNTGGRPMGMAWDIDDNLIVADARKGLMVLRDTRSDVGILTTEEGGVPFGFLHDVDTGGGGIAYFTDASSKFHDGDEMADLMEHRGNGRFLSYSLVTRQTTKLIGDLCFPTGVAVNKDQSFVLISEAWKYRVLRYWLTGEKKGTSDVFIDNLPGFPGKVSTAPDGGFWLAIPNLRNPRLDRLMTHPHIRKLLWRLPRTFTPTFKRYAMVIKIDAGGTVVQTLQSPSCAYGPITSVNECDGALFLGSPDEVTVGRLLLAGN